MIEPCSLCTDCAMRVTKESPSSLPSSNLLRTVCCRSFLLPSTSNTGSLPGTPLSPPDAPTTRHHHPFATGADPKYSISAKIVHRVPSQAASWHGHGDRAIGGSLLPSSNPPRLLHRQQFPFRRSLSVPAITYITPALQISLPRTTIVVVSSSRFACF